jgi:hypothetical protein
MFTIEAFASSFAARVKAEGLSGDTTYEIELFLREFCDVVRFTCINPGSGKAYYMSISEPSLEKYSCIREAIASSIIEVRRYLRGEV